MKELTVKEMASLGGKARSKKLTPKQRSDIARKGGKERARLDKIRKESGFV